MNILVITSSYPRYPGDISGIFVQEHAELLAEAGHQVRVLAWSDGSAKTRSTAPSALTPCWVRYAPPSAENLFFRDGAPENLDENPWLALLSVPAALAMIQEALEYAEWADLIIGHWLVPAGWIARFVGWLEDIPSLIIGHSGGVHLLAALPSLARRPLIHALRGPLTVPSHALRKKLDRLGLVARVIPMGVPMRGASAPTTDDWLVMSRHVPIKRIDLAIRAFARARVPGRLEIAGDGPERRTLEKLAARERARASFHGWVAGQERESLLASSRYFLLPSQVIGGRFEGFPTGLIRAQLAGLIPLVSDSPGLSEAVCDPACIVRGDDVDVWARAIQEMARARPDWRLARDFALQFTWDALREDWLAMMAHARR